MRRIETLIVVVSLAFYGWFVWHFGTSGIIRLLGLAGWGLAITISLDTVTLVANTTGWRVVIVEYPRRLGLARLFAARIAGEAVDYITPSAQLGGSFVSAIMVRRKLPMAAGLASVAIASLSQGIAQIVFIAVALLLSLHLLPVASDLFWPVVGGFAVAVGLTWAFYFVQTRRPFSHLLRAAARFDLERFGGESTRQSAHEADNLLMEFYARPRGRLALSCLAYIVAWCVGPLEIYILLSLLGQPASLHVAILIEALGLLIERVTFMIPAKLVTREGGKALILTLLGYPPQVGFVVGLLRHGKEMFWVLAGLGALAFHRLAQQREPEATESDGGDSEELQPRRHAARFS